MQGLCGGVLQQEALRPCRHRRFQQSRIIERSQQDDRRCVIAHPELADHLDAAETRHADIADDHVHRARSQDRQQRRAVGTLMHQLDVGEFGQQQGESAAHQLLVIGESDRRPTCCSHQVTSGRRAINSTP
jgi:hypothetical protein